MIGFVLTGHGQFAPGLKSAVDMVAGDNLPRKGCEEHQARDDFDAAERIAKARALPRCVKLVMAYWCLLICLAVLRSIKLSQ